MMDIVEAVRGITQEELSNFWMPQLGVVTSIYPHQDESDKDNYECDVRLKNPDLEIRRAQIATQVIGFVGPPNVGDLVLVVFANGDINYPIVVGRLYNDEDRPPASEAEEVVYVSPQEENSDVRRIYLEFPSGTTLAISDEEANLTSGETKIRVKKDGDVEIKSKGNVSIAADGDASLKSSGNMSISGSDVKIESQKAMGLDCGTDLKLESKKSADIKSAEIGMEAQTALNATTQGKAKVQALQLLLKSDAFSELSSSAVTKIKGSLVTIN